MTRAAAERAGLLGTDGSYLWACLAAVSLASTRAFDVCGRRLDDFGLMVADFSLLACCHGDRVPQGWRWRGRELNAAVVWFSFVWWSVLVVV